MPKFVKPQEDAVGFFNVESRRKNIQTFHRFPMSDEELREKIGSTHMRWVCIIFVCMGGVGMTAGV